MRELPIIGKSRLDFSKDWKTGDFAVASTRAAWYLANMIQVAIIGAGPSGFFMAAEMFKRFPGASVAMFERRLFPYGLVRFGVSPDHQATRRAIGTFDQIARTPGFHYFGNVDAARIPGMERLRQHFHAVIVCTGAEKPVLPDIAGVSLEGVVSGLDFARWANGELRAIHPSVLNHVETAVIIGNGNVALDAARMLARPSADWVSTDIAPHAMEALMHHRVRHIVIAGRRGPSEVSFTPAEFEELVSLPGWDVWAPEGLPFEGVKPKPASGRKIEFLFHFRVKKINGDKKVQSIEFENATKKTSVEIPAQLVIIATGQRGEPFASLPFDDERGIIPNEQGRVAGHPGVYVCGWVKRGAQGVIGVNKKDAIETAARIQEDSAGFMARPVTPFVLPGSAAPVMSWNDWKKIDAMEIQRGSAVGRPRLNFTAEEARLELQKMKSG